MYFDVAMVIILVKPAMLVSNSVINNYPLFIKTIEVRQLPPYLWQQLFPKCWLQPLMFLAYPAMLACHTIQHSSTYLFFNINIKTISALEMPILMVLFTGLPTRSFDLVLEFNSRVLARIYK